MTHKFVIKNEKRNGVLKELKAKILKEAEHSAWIKPTKQGQKDLQDAAHIRISLLETDIGRTPRGLDLNHLRLANVARSVDATGFDHPLARWSIAEWTNALCGEAGEAANIAKKLIRIRYDTRGNKPNDKDEAKLLRRLARELADVVVYADLALASEGINLSDNIIKTYNRKSKEVGFNFKLTKA